MATVDPIPEGYPLVTPYLHVNGTSAGIDFYIAVLEGTERVRMPGDTRDSSGHAELQLGNSVIMRADEFASLGALGPTSNGGSPVTIHVYVEDVDAVFDRAVRAGAQALEEPTDQFYGDRSGPFEDPLGHRWNVASRVEDVSPDLRRCSDAWPNSPTSNKAPARMPPSRPQRPGRRNEPDRRVCGLSWYASALARRPFRLALSIGRIAHMTATEPAVSVVPANEAGWEDLQAIFSARGVASRCLWDPLAS